MTIQLYRQTQTVGGGHLNLSTGNEDLPPKDRAVLGDLKVLKA